MKPGVPLVVSVDVEDWPQSTWDHSLEVTARAQWNTERLLDLLARHQARVTMFVLGKFAEKFPETVRRIAQSGHEVASHGYGHIEIFKQSAAEFREDVRRANGLLEDLIGRAVVGYRAPDFSIVRRTLWALDVLAGQGVRYDSSIFPIDGRRYGIPDWPAHPAEIALASGRSIVELPPSTITLFGRRWPVAGGGYHRLLPSPLIRLAIARHARQRWPFVAYCHPYEFDPGEFAGLNLPVPFKTRLHQGLGRRGFRVKFEHLLTHSTLFTAADVADLAKWPHHRLEAA